MQHGSGKLLQNIGADYIGRNAIDCTNDKCAMCQFAKDRSHTILSSFTNLMKNKQPCPSPVVDLATMSKHWDIACAGLQDIPIGNISAWVKLQSDDPAISQAIKYKKSGQNPPKKDNSQEMKEVRSL